MGEQPVRVADEISVAIRRMTGCRAQLCTKRGNVQIVGTASVGDGMKPCDRAAKAEHATAQKDNDSTRPTLKQRGQRQVGIVDQEDRHFMLHTDMRRGAGCMPTRPWWCVLGSGSLRCDNLWRFGALPYGACGT